MFGHGFDPSYERSLARVVLSLGICWRGDVWNTKIMSTFSRRRKYISKHDFTRVDFTPVRCSFYKILAEASRSQRTSQLQWSFASGGLFLLVKCAFFGRTTCRISMCQTLSTGSSEVIMLIPVCHRSKFRSMMSDMPYSISALPFELITISDMR